MSLLPLNFPVFYHCAVKGNTNLPQYNAVSVLLLGKLRKDCIDIVIGDAEAAGYIRGRRHIKKELLTLVSRISNEEAQTRIEGLGFQNHTRIADAVREVLTIVDIPTDTQQKMKNNPDDLAVIADAFIMAVKCPTKDSFLLGPEEKECISICYSKDGTKTEESLSFGKPGPKSSINEQQTVLQSNIEQEAEKGENDKLEYEIYQRYIYKLTPLFSTVKIKAGTFPVELLSEIKDILLHMARYKVNGSIFDLYQAQSHVFRATSDAYKYFCHIVMDRYNTTMDTKKGTFFKPFMLPEKLTRLLKDSKKKWSEARQYETVGECAPDIVSKLYEEAFNSFVELDQELDLYISSPESN